MDSHLIRVRYKKKSVRMYAMSVCVVKRVEKSQPIVLAWQSGVRCAVSQLTWPGLCVHVCVGQLRVADLKIWGLVGDFFLEHSVFTAWGRQMTTKG